MSNKLPGEADRARFSRQIDEAFEDAAKMAGSNLAPTDFFEKFLSRAMNGIGSPAGAVWLRTPQGFLQVAVQQNLEKVGLDDKRGGRQCHNEVLRQVFQTTPPRPILIEPQGRLGNTPPEAGGVPAANLTDYYALFAPIVTNEKQSIGLLELFQDSSFDPRLYPTFLQYTHQMAGYASQYHNFAANRPAQAAGSERVFAQIEAFARLIHGTLDPTECAYHVANEGRRLVEADRLCVGVRHGSKATVEAVSGSDVVEKASTHVRRMRNLFDAVLKFNDKLVFNGTRDAALPPDVLHALDEYLAESQPKLLVVSPIRDEREKESEKPARSILMMECFNPPEQIDPLVQRLEVVGKHAAPALYNAAEMKRIPFKLLWWPIVKLQDGLGGKAKLYTFLGVIAVVLLVIAMVFIPFQLEVDATGQYMPEQHRFVYAPLDGVVEDIKVEPGQSGIAANGTVIRLHNEELKRKWLEQDEKRASAQATLQLLGPKLTDRKGDNYLDTVLKYATALGSLQSAEKMQESEIKTYNAIRTEPGYFNATAPQLVQASDGSLPRAWTVISGSDFKSMINNRTVRPNEPLVRLGAVDGPWRGELKIPQRSIGHVKQAFVTRGMFQTEPDPRDPSKTVKYLTVKVLFAGFETTKFMGKLYEADVGVEANPNKDNHNETEPVVPAYIRVDLSALTPAEQQVFRTAGLEMHVKVQCGPHAMGYSMFHGVWEWFYEKVVFFF